MSMFFLNKGTTKQDEEPSKLFKSIVDGCWLIDDMTTDAKVQHLKNRIIEFQFLYKNLNPTHPDTAQCRYHIYITMRHLMRRIEYIKQSESNVL